MKGRRKGSKGSFKSKAVDRMIDESYARGYKDGQQDGRQEGGSNRADDSGDMSKAADGGFKKGYKQGYYDGGDAIADSVLPADAILPEVSIQQIVEKGVWHFHDQFHTLLGTGYVVDAIRGALDRKEPFSLVRLGDGEALTLAQDSVLSIDKVKEEGHFLGYAGVDVPDIAARDQLVQSIRKATVVGFPKMREYTYQPLAVQAFRALGLDYRSLKLANSIVNYSIYQEGHLGALLRGRSVLLVGNKAPELAAVMSEHGIAIAGTVSPVNGVKDVPRVMEEVFRHSFDIALVSAGIAAVVIAQRIASEMGKVAIDFGHLANTLASRKDPFV